MHECWVGRFAPSPSGPLHFGSLVAALGSYLIAKQKGGEWLVRIEDLDPPREVPGAAKDILYTLESFGLKWDRHVVYQSQRKPYYLEILEQLEAQAVIYRCDCSRSVVRQRNAGLYDGYCRDRELSKSAETAVRIEFPEGYESFFDQVRGHCEFKSVADRQDFVIRRRDGLFAYQLAVVADDIAQGVNHVVRGADILDSTPRQSFLYHCLGHPIPIYFHLPLAVSADGKKLSKRLFSSPIFSCGTEQANNVVYWLVQALAHLGQNTHEDLYELSPDEILEWALKNWQLQAVGIEPKVYPASSFEYRH